MPSSTEILDSKRITLDGQEMLVDLRDQIISRRLAAGQVYDSVLRRVIRECVKPGMTVVDVGAHIGWQTVLMSRQVGESGIVWAIEPSPRNGQFLKANLELNNCEGTQLTPFAAWDSETVMDLYFSPTNSGDHNLIDDDTRESVAVPTMKLDVIEYADFVKIDAQGSEHAILRGARELIANSPDLVIVIEYSPHHLVAFGDPLALLHDLRERFEVSVMGKSFSVDALPKAVNVEKGNHVNLLCRRRT